MARAEEADSGREPGVARVRDLVLLTGSSAAAAFLVPSLPLVGLPLAAMALAWLFYRQGAYAALGATLFACAVVSASFPAAASLVVPSLIVAGPFAARALRTWDPLGVVTVLTGVIFAGTVGLEALLQAERGRTLAQAVRIDAAAAARQARAILVTSGAGTADSEAVRSQVETVRRLLVQAWPSVYLLGALATAVVTIAAVVWASRRAGGVVRGLPAPERLDVSIHVVWGVVGSLVAFAVSRFTHDPGGIAAAIGWNLLIVVRWVLFAQGVGVFAGLYRRAGIGALGRGVGYALLLVSEGFLPLVSLTGLADLWLNFRRLPRDGASGEAGLEGPVGTD
ncbi:MAG: DUF2232 domain-containing protein [Coriobacteriia bacterium]